MSAQPNRLFIHYAPHIRGRLCRRSADGVWTPITWETGGRAGPGSTCLASHDLPSHLPEEIAADLEAGRARLSDEFNAAVTGAHYELDDGTCVTCGQPWICQGYIDALVEREDGR
jgi:hypothetical protein